MTRISDARAKPDKVSDSHAASFTFAQFWKCALQVNSHGYSKAFRGQDHGLGAEAFLEALLKECQEQDIALVGLADHGSVTEVDAIRQYLTGHGIVVLPGFEICTTESIHWVCLFHEGTSVEQLSRYLGKLDLLDPSVGVRSSSLGGAELLAIMDEIGGLCFAAHATDPKGVLTQKAYHLWTDPRLKAAQIRETPAKAPQEFRQILLNKDPAYRRAQPMALINAADVEKPERLRDARASCFIKMTQPGFQALSTAFLDPESRVRLHDDLEDVRCSRIERMQIDGGYLDGVDIRFSPHLNAIIGGRGTGKSTLLECLRYALGLDHKTAEARKQGDSIIKENLGKEHGRVEVTLVSSHQQMLSYRVVRRYGEPLRVIGPNGNESSLTIADLVPGIEVYGQNEIYELARDENALVRVLDRYLPDRAEHEQQLAAIQKRLRTNAEKLNQAEEQRDEVIEQLKKLPGLEEQTRQFDAIGFTKKLELVPLLEKERQIPVRVKEEAERLALSLEGVKDGLPDATFLGDKAIEGLPHAEVLARVRAVLERLRAKAEEHITATEKVVANAEHEIKLLLDELDRLRSFAEAALEKEFDSLPTVAGRGGAAVARTYQSLQRQIASIRPQQTKVDTLAALVAALQQERRNLLGELSDLRNARTRALEKEVKSLNRKLAGKLRLEVQPNANRERLKEFLSRIPGIGAKSLGWVDEVGDLTIPALVEACRAGPSALLAKGWGVTPARAEAICKLARAELLSLESVDLDDRVVLELNVAHEGENYRSLNRLSTGQQCTAILHLLLLDNADPLLMDQPEDNLDNAFIADRIVQELREAKTARQFIFATHNANIPVFGDAEWIGVFSATEERGAVPSENQGSIDVPHIRDHAARILDGGREAFLQRQHKYGY